MAEIDIDIKGLISERLQLNDIVWADKIICMSPSHQVVLNMYTKKEKVFVLGNGISDPYGQSVEIYRLCRDEITAAVDRLAEEGFFSEMQVISVKPEHIKSIAKLEQICFSEPWSEEALLSAFRNGTRFFVAEKDGNVLGYLGISCILDEGYITNVAVFPEYRNSGVASALLRRVFSHAKDNGLSFVSLEVRKSNTAAISLYEKFGFKVEGERKNFYRAPLENALIMTKRFE